MHIHTQTHTKTHRHIYTQIDRHAHTHRGTETHTHKQTDTHTDKHTQMDTQTHTHAHEHEQTQTGRHTHTIHTRTHRGSLALPHTYGNERFPQCAVDSVGFGTCFGEGTPLLEQSANALGAVVWARKEVRFLGGPDSLWRSQVCSVVTTQQPHGKLLPSLLQAYMAYFTVVQLLGTQQSHSVDCTQPKP